MIYLYLHCPYTEEILQIISIDGFNDDRLRGTLFAYAHSAGFGDRILDFPYINCCGIVTKKDPMSIHVYKDPKRTESCVSCSKANVHCKPRLPEPTQEDV